MRVIVVLALWLAAAAAQAQPVSFQIRGDVPAGQKPQLRVRALADVTDLRIELERDDGKTFVLGRKVLASGQSVTFDVGDGAAGRATYRGTISAAAKGAAKSRLSKNVSFSTFVRGALRIGYDVAHLHLDERRLEFTLSRPPARADVTAFGDDGRQLGRGEAHFRGKAAGAWVSVSWQQPAETRVMKLRLHAVSTTGLEATVELIPWSVAVDHEEVNFATGSATIESTELGKLDASLSAIEGIVNRTGRFLDLKLYIAGHTDTVGSARKNRALSRARALSIARYFRRKGLRIPIAVAGFGQDVLAVESPDETELRANRRVDYVLGPAGGAPPFRGAYRRVHADWRNVP